MPTSCARFQCRWLRKRARLSREETFIVRLGLGEWGALLPESERAGSTRETRARGRWQVASPMMMRCALFSYDDMNDATNGWKCGSGKTRNHPIKDQQHVTHSKIIDYVLLRTLSVFLVENILLNFQYLKGFNALVDSIFACKTPDNSVSDVPAYLGKCRGVYSCASTEIG